MSGLHSLRFAERFRVTLQRQLILELARLIRTRDDSPSDMVTFG